MHRRLAVPAALLALLLPAAAVTAGAPPLDVDLAQVRFRARGDAEGHTLAKLKIVGDLKAAEAPAFVADPGAEDGGEEALAVTLGPVVLAGGEGGTVQRRSVSRRSWSVTVRCPEAVGGRLRLKVRPSRAEFTLTATGFRAGELLAHGPAGVPFTLATGAGGGDDTVEFTVTGERRWDFEHRVGPKPLPGGGGGGGGGGAGAIHDLVTLGKGFYSGIHQERFEVVRDQAAWQALWLEHAGSGSPPAVDFSQRMVVGAWLGWRCVYLDLHSGTTVDILDLQPSGGGGYSATVQQTMWHFACPLPFECTQPFHIVSVPRLDVPVGATRTVTGKGCE